LNRTGRLTISVANRRERGVTLLLGTICLPAIVAILGITIDLSIMYSIKTKLQMACDGAAVAALRSLNLGQDFASQQGPATTVANEWFAANFAGNFMGAQGTGTGGVTVPTISMSQSSQTFITTVDISAVTYSPSYFMKYYSFGATRIGATSEASRRNVVITLVLDRSGSMQPGGSSAFAGSPCQAMVNAAKQFSGAFQNNRDYMGLVTFAESVHIGLAPTQDFQTQLGYTNASGTASGQLDVIRCSGGTNTSAGLALGWNLNYQTALPGALNIIVLMTDGQPTASTFKFVTTNSLGAYPDPTGSATSVVSSSSTCKDSANHAMNGTPAGNMVANPTNWLGLPSVGQEYTGGTSAANYVINLGANSYAPWATFSGPIGALYADTSSFYGVDPWFSNTTTYAENIEKSSSQSPGCAFLGNGGSPTSDIAFIPPYDLFGNLPTGYLSLPDGFQTIAGASRIRLTRPNLANVNFNVTDNAANFARSANTLPGGTAFPGNLIYVIGLGSNGGVDSTLLQRIANDPNGCATCSPSYGAYAAITGQPIGKYIFAPTANDLSAAFAEIASQIIRISK